MRTTRVDLDSVFGATQMRRLCVIRVLLGLRGLMRIRLLIPIRKASSFCSRLLIWSSNPSLSKDSAVLNDMQ